VAHGSLALLSAIGLVGLAACSAGGSQRPYEETKTIQALRENMRNGVVTSLDEPRFSRSAASEGLWHPERFIAHSSTGIYFLEPYDPKRTPVLFVHGYEGSPRDFSYLIAKLDTTRFQAWVYNYPSGLRLGLLAGNLEASLDELRVRYRFDCVSIVAHSMGGLVARGFLLRNAVAAQPQCVPLFVSISTPWQGNWAAAIGARWAPDMVSTWRDIAPGSSYLRSLFAAPFPDNTRYCLVYTSDDRTITVASQLGLPARQDAAQVIGYDATHVGVLRDAAAVTGLMSLLEQSAP
jgi:pimeloyl-ACP methyl ester carboxylesterase